MYNFLAVASGSVIGVFVEKEFGKSFTYEANVDNFWTLCKDFPHKIHMSDGSVRQAYVKKTLAKVVVDEDEYGNPVVETWQIKQHKKYK